MCNQPYYYQQLLLVMAGKLKVEVSPTLITSSRDTPKNGGKVYIWRRAARAVRKFFLIPGVV